MGDQGEVTRRDVLLGAGGTALALVGLTAIGTLVERDVLPGRVAMHRLLRLDGPDGEPPDAAVGPRVDGSFVSTARAGRRTSWRLLYPPGHTPGDRLQLLVVLHGRGGDHRSVTEVLALDRYLAAAVAGGVAPFAIVGVDGGDRYWHARAAGDDSGAMVTRELLPLMAARGLDTRRPAYLGYSMGGYGVLLLAEQVGPDQVAAVVAESPALWHTADDSAGGAFDGPADFAAHNVLTGLDRLDPSRVRIDCGTGDPFYPIAQDLARALHPRPAGGFGPGAHTSGYWRRLAPAQLRFVGTHLATA